MFKNIDDVNQNNNEGVTPGATPMGPVDEVPRQSEVDNSDDESGSSDGLGVEQEKEEVNLSDGNDNN